MNKRILLAVVALTGVSLFHPLRAGAQEVEEELPVYLRDRGRGVSSSMFGTYIGKGEFFIYPFYEYYYDSDIEYEPVEFGYDLKQEFRGKYEAHEGLIFFGLGLTDRLLLEVEAAVIDAELIKSSDDPSAQPDTLAESGLGDVEAQLRWRWAEESAGAPEVFSFFETVFPLQTDKVLIGTQDWEFKLGAGIIKGFRWGTLTLRTAAAYDGKEQKVEVGEYALEYLKRISKVVRVVSLIEGEEDELDLINELQLHVSPKVYIKLNMGFGLTSKATDYAPEVGVMFSTSVF